MREPNFKSSATRWVHFFYIVSVTFACQLSALEFDVATIPVNPKHSIDILSFSNKPSDGTNLLIIETPVINQLQKQMQGLSDEPVRYIKVFQRRGSQWDLVLTKALKDSMDLVDTISTPEGIRLVGLQGSELFYLDENTGLFAPLLKAAPMFSGRSWGESPVMEMFSDINDDGLDDFLMPTFEGWAVALQTSEGFSAPQTIGPSPSMSYSDTPRFVAYRAEEAFLVDENNDGLNDITFWRDGYFEVHRQNPVGEFSEIPMILDVNLKDMLSGYTQLSIGEDVDNAGGANRMLDEVADLNDDGISDLVVKRIKADGIFGWESEYEVYFGEVNALNKLEFTESPSSVIQTDGFQFDNERQDLSGDGNQEFVVTSVDISLGTVIKGLITRAVSLDISVYRIKEGKFSSAPSVRKTISARFDFGSGDLLVPAVLGADITGDGQKDLLVQKGEATLLVYPGQAGETMFAKKAIKLSLDLPESRAGIQVKDINNDGRDELILDQGDDHNVVSIVSFRD
ncbi:MAG: VCBS repeat-containing protein [Pseudomonadales bacterium]|nr:VCBS repeat-containing protein [Pseudomonadales bacterium]